jgi:hypothetical protein
LSDSQRSDVLDRYLAGESATALAKELSVRRATVFSLVRRAGVQTRCRILGDEDVAVARNMYEAGQSLAVIGEHFGVADRTVFNVFRRLGIPTRASGTNQLEPEAFPIAVRHDFGRVVHPGDRDRTRRHRHRRGLIALAKNLELRVIAEGIDNHEQVAVLLQLGCPDMQGYLFCAPQPIDQAPTLIQTPTLGLANADPASFNAAC